MRESCAKMSVSLFHPDPIIGLSSGDKFNNWKISPDAVDQTRFKLWLSLFTVAAVICTGVGCELYSTCCFYQLSRSYTLYRNVSTEQFLSLPNIPFIEHICFPVLFNVSVVRSVQQTKFKY